jgi:hypothetical protein
VLRVDVARQRREHLDVGRGQRAFDAGAIADADLVEVRLRMTSRSEAEKVSVMVVSL